MEKLATAGLTLNLRKCIFASDEIPFWGFHQLQKYMNMRQLTNKNTKFQWTAIHDTEFNNVKKAFNDYFVASL